MGGSREPRHLIQTSVLAADSVELGELAALLDRLPPSIAAVVALALDGAAILAARLMSDPWSARYAVHEGTTSDRMNGPLCCWKGGVGGADKARGRGKGAAHTFHGVGWQADCTQTVRAKNDLAVASSMPHTFPRHSIRLTCQRCLVGWAGRERGGQLQLAAHLCGQAADDLLSDPPDLRLVTELAAKGFGRIQLNPTEASTAHGPISSPSQQLSELSSDRTVAGERLRRAGAACPGSRPAAAGGPGFGAAPGRVHLAGQ